MARSRPGNATAPENDMRSGGRPSGSGTAMPTAVNRDSGLVRTSALVTYCSSPRSDFLASAGTGRAAPGQRAVALRLGKDLGGGQRQRAAQVLVAEQGRQRGPLPFGRAWVAARDLVTAALPLISRGQPPGDRRDGHGLRFLGPVAVDGSG